MDHSMDFHAVHTAPNKGFADVKPHENGTFVYQASSPGVFMYHCGTGPVLLHVGNGMHGTIIVKLRWVSDEMMKLTVSLS